MDDQDNIRNLSIIAHVDHGKSTLTDSLIAKAGIIAESTAGDARFMDGRKDEKERGITIKSAGVSLYFNFKGRDLLINLIDSPGHVDFSSEVTAALRVTDGAVVVVDCVEKVCVQTETVLRQALQERIKPILMMNKIDRPFIELKRTTEEMQQDFKQVIESVNVIIAQNEEEIMGDIQVCPIKGSVVFGSGYQQWAFTLETFAKMWAPKFKIEVDAMIPKLWGEWRFDRKGSKWTTNESDSEGTPMARSFCAFILDPILKVINFCLEDKLEPLKKFLVTMNVEITPEQWELKEKKLCKAVLHQWLDASDALMSVIAVHLPSPKVSQKYRCPLLQTGDLNDEFAQSIMACNPKGPLMLQISKMIPADKGRFQAFGRVFSGTIASGDKVFIMENYNPDTDKNSLKEHSVTRTVLIMGSKTEPINDVPCGNTVGLQGIDKFMIKTGTITNSKDAQPLKAMKQTVSAVVRISVRVKDQSNLQKLIDSLDKLRKTDPLAIIEHTDEGEHIIAGSGELHVEILQNDLCDLSGVEVIKDDPIVSQRECCMAVSSEQCLAKSPNKHNRLLMTAEPMSDELVKKIEKEDIFPSQDPKVRARILINEFGWEDDQARKIWSFGPNGTGPNFFIDATKAIQYLIEIKDHCVSAFQELTKSGPLAFEEMRGVTFKLLDATLHTDSIHRGANQISPATRNGCMASQLCAEPRQLEPIFLVEITGTTDIMGGVYATLNKRRGSIFDTIEEQNRIILKGYLPVGESFGFNQDLRANTGGQAFPQCVFNHWEVLNEDPFTKGGKGETMTLLIRKRKGRKQEVPNYKDQCDKL